MSSCWIHVADSAIAFGCMAQFGNSILHPLEHPVRQRAEQRIADGRTGRRRGNRGHPFARAKHAWTIAWRPFTSTIQKSAGQSFVTNT